MLNPKYPHAVETVIARLESAGFAAYVVGGALRDTLLGREAHDFDVTTSALPCEMQQVFEGFHVIETGLKHGTLTVMVAHEAVEVTTFRIDGEYRDARHPEGVTFIDRIEDDLARRDFTVNAMAYSKRRGLVDVFGGREDLESRVIRAVGDPSARFGEDALRILRAYRFMSKLNFDIEEKTLAATAACREGLARISAERITTELSGIFVGVAACRSLSLMLRNGIFSAFAPAFWVTEEAIGAMDCLPAVFEVRLAYFLRDCEDRGESLLGCLRLSGASLSRVRVLLRLRDFDFTAVNGERVRRLMAAAGKYADDIDGLVHAGDFFRMGEADRETVRLRLAQIRARHDCLSLSELAIDGRMLMAEGIGGRAIGKTLAALLDRVMADPTQNRTEVLLAMAREMRDENAAQAKENKATDIDQGE